MPFPGVLVRFNAFLRTGLHHRVNISRNASKSSLGHVERDFLHRIQRFLLPVLLPLFAYSAGGLRSPDLAFRSPLEAPRCPNRSHMPPPAYSDCSGVALRHDVPVLCFASLLYHDQLWRSSHCQRLNVLPASPDWKRINLARIKFKGRFPRTPTWTESPFASLGCGLMDLFQRILKRKWFVPISHR